MNRDLDNLKLETQEILERIEYVETELESSVSKLIYEYMELESGVKVPFNLAYSKPDLEKFVAFVKILNLHESQHVKENLIDFLGRAGNFKFTEEGRIICYKAVNPNVSGDLIRLHFSKYETIKNALSKINISEECKLNHFIDIDEDTVFQIISGQRSDGLNRTLSEAYSLGYLETVTKTFNSGARAYCDLMKNRMIYFINVEARVHPLAVNVDPEITCSYGLHVGNYEYANDFARQRSGSIMKCEVSPLDILAVPNDAAQGKVRCQAFTPVEII